MKKIKIRPGEQEKEMPLQKRGIIRLNNKLDTELMQSDIFYLVQGLTSLPT
jgi:hypothetical protein